MFTFRRRPAECAACKAKDMTIVLLSDVVDWHRANPAALPRVPGALAEATRNSMSDAVAIEKFVPIEGPDKLWKTEGEEDLEALYESKSISLAELEQGLAAEQAQNTHIQLVKN